ncbi:uncharacterized protein ATNIH1004_004542 [Aspergillus tanneri]|uniref:Uncharacterized protein n=1 Tax=Aspergillus tanneri TaxID=1220188 RepID=A0A5M9N278_9EURO|nr:uncharacterized protein ATNIH1004_004542 [Aspergillus tanneri]KAA8648657.1 hypothetical protein ATNIH1004_004542 [Aspergillus tanneri]
MATDADGDSQMASSPESAQIPSDSSQNGARTPTKTIGIPSELSPPGSQTQPASANVVGGMPAITTMTSAPDQQPGAMWMNKRAEEEFQRAMEFVVDKDFSLDEFGDPFDESDMQETVF